MNKEIKFGHTGGFPLVQDTLNFTQEGIKTLSALATALSSLEGCSTLIVEGCRLVNGVISPGVVIINGEVLPFAGGVIDDHVIINETKQTAIFKDGEGHDVYVTRSAIFGSGAEEISWREFRRISGVPYDYIVDSDESLEALNNKSNVSHILIKRGTWGARKSIALAPSVKSITGEAGAAIVLHGDVNLSGHGCSISNLNILVTSEGETRAYGLDGFTGISNCHIEVDMSNDWDDDSQSSLLRDCVAISNCTFKKTGSHYKVLALNCKQFSHCSFSSQDGAVIDGCTEIYNCFFKNCNIQYSEGIISCNFVTDASWGAVDPVVRDSHKVLHCHYSGRVATPYRDSFSSFSETYGCEDTPDGGFNSKIQVL